MQAFKAKRVEGIDAPPNPLGGIRSHAVRAPGRIVMVVHEGSCWVQRDDGSREDLTAKSVVVWEPGERVEYGTGSEGCKIESYWAGDFPENEWKAIFAEVFGPDAIG
jgi:hypothetical protein